MNPICRDSQGHPLLISLAAGPAGSRETLLLGSRSAAGQRPGLPDAMQLLQAVAEQSQGGLAGGAALAEAQLRGQGSVGAKTELVLFSRQPFQGPLASAPDRKGL